jgi:hypothetical protein
MIWLYVSLLDFLIPFLCDPDLQCGLSSEKKSVTRFRSSSLGFYIEVSQKWVKLVCTYVPTVLPGIYTVLLTLCCLHRCEKV